MHNSKEFYIISFFCLKVTIVPRTSAALGFAQYMPSDKKLVSKEEVIFALSHTFSAILVIRQINVIELQSVVYQACSSMKNLVITK